eukprot:1700117-Prymnesium_polylepis.1
MAVKYAAFSKPKLTALPAFQEMEWAGDRALTLVTPSDFNAASLSKNLDAEAWSWDEERESSTSRKRKAMEKQ